MQLTYIGRYLTCAVCQLLEDRWRAARGLVARPTCFQFGKFRIDAELSPFAGSANLARLRHQADRNTVGMSCAIDCLSGSFCTLVTSSSVRCLKRVVASTTSLLSRSTVCSLGTSATSILAQRMATGPIPINSSNRPTGIGIARIVASQRSLHRH